MKNYLPFLSAFVAGGVVVALIFVFTSKNPSTHGGWNKLTLALDEIDRNYVDTVDRASLSEHALTAILSDLDPHSVYMEPRELKDLDESLSGGFEGVGIQFNVPNDTAVVLNVIPGGPSEKAGLVMGDRILKVDDKVIAGVNFPQDSMVRLMRGPRDTKVVLTIGRAGQEIPFEITRQRIPDISVPASFMIDSTTGYVQVSKFSQTTDQEFFEAVYKLYCQGLKRLIVDLRSNTGGYMHEACNMANLFLPKDALIVYIEGVHRRREDINANGAGVFQNIKLSVLIDEGSASASEIFAGAIQDNDRGVLVGRRSFGKGLVQEPIYFSDGSGMKLTVARYYTPSGRCIQKPVKDYDTDFYDRYVRGEFKSAEKIPVDTSQCFKTVGGRKVYGGGGIIPDIFVPVRDITDSKFYASCGRKAILVRFATHFHDSHAAVLDTLRDFNSIDKYLKSQNVEQSFLRYAAVQGIKAAPSDWAVCKKYMLPQIMGLCGRFSAGGEEIYYRYVLPMDDIINAAVRNSSDVSLGDK